jgi:Zn-dependent M28 family amino/carboxypeptidase
LLYVGAGDSLAVRRAGEARAHVVVMPAAALGSSATSYIPALIEAGAAGIVLLADQRNFDLFARSRGDARYFTDADVHDPVWQADLPVIIAGPALASAIVPASAPARFSPLADTLRVTFAAAFEEVRSANIAAVLRGSDAALASEYVVFTAHYDHLGISTPDARGDSIYNGFSDDAAGVAMLLALGDVFRREPASRSVLLLFFSGEERGLLGSTYFAAQPLIPLEQMKALINLDAGAPPAPPVDWRIAGGAASSLGAVTERALAARGWTTQLGAASPNSDYWPFLQRGVPAIFIIPGDQWEGMSAEQRAPLNARWNRYHRADDEYAEDFPFIGLQRYAEVALAVGRAVAQ